MNNTEATMIYRAAIKIDGKTTLVPSRKHTYHANRGAALRALDRWSRRSKVNMRGFIWPVSAGPHLTTDRIANGDIPVYVETIAL